MDNSGHHRVKGDSGSRPNNLVTMDGGQASHAPSIHEQGQAARGTIDILQKIAQALQRAVQLVVVSPQQSAIDRMARYQAINFLGKKDGEPSMEENWLEIIERMLRQMHCTPEEILECAISLLQNNTYQWWVSVITTTPSESITWEFFVE